MSCFWRDRGRSHWPALRIFGNVGYKRDSTNETQITVTDAVGNLLGTANWSYTLSSIPVAIGAGHRLGGGAAVLVLSLAGEVQFVTVTSTMTADPRPLPFVFQKQYARV